MKARAPCVLAIGGLDPGGGAGILADARAIAHAGAYACAAVTILTVQSTEGLRSAKPAPGLLAACREVLKNQTVHAIKVGALGTEANAVAVGRLLREVKLPTVVDPVMLPSRGRSRLLAVRAVATLEKHVLPWATLITANAPEASILTGQPVTNLEEARSAARALGRALVKGGHLDGKDAIDVLCIDDELHELRAPRLPKLRTHGGGCVLASLVAGRLARGESVLAAVRWAKRAHHRALANAESVGGPTRVLFAR